MRFASKDTTATAGGDEDGRDLILELRFRAACTATAALPVVVSAGRDHALGGGSRLGAGGAGAMMIREVRQITSTGEWLDWRREDITASRAAALFDEHPYISRDQLADIMRATAPSGSGALPPDNASMRRGRIFEAACAVAIAEDHPEWQIEKATTYHRIPELRLGCTPDYFAAVNGLIQIKTVSPHQWDKYHGRPPLWQQIQTLIEMMVTEREWGVLACMVMSPSYPVHYFNVPRHEAAERRILDAVAAWWAAWDSGEIPHPASSAEIAAALDDGSYVDLSDNNYLCAALPEREHWKAEIAAAEKRVKQVDEALKEALGPASTGWVPGFNITFRSQHRRETVIPARDIRVLRVRAAAEEEGADVQ
jgi:hypothetical protein